VWIGETNEQGLTNIGANLVYKRFIDGVEQSGSLQQVNTNVFNPAPREFNVTVPAPDTAGTNPFPPPLRPDTRPPATDGIQTQAGAGIVASIVDTPYGTIDGILRAVDRDTDVDLISKPELLVVNGTPAEIRAGGQVPYQDIAYTAGRAQLNVKWMNVGVNMLLTPTIMPNDYVKITLNELNVKDITRIENLRGVDMPVFSTRSQTGEVTVPNGVNLVIGGLSSSVTRHTERRVPIVGALPIIGIPFRGRESDMLNTHLLIFVSPTIVNLRDMTPLAKSAQEFWQNEEWRNTDAIQQEIDSMNAGEDEEL
jgi:type II secretory pathway component GspD/PulD (secretin)